MSPPTGPSPVQRPLVGGQRVSPALLRFGLAAVILLLALLIWWLRPPAEIEPAHADSIAEQLLAGYASHSGDAPSHFEGPHMVGYDDGWEYRWVYLPCADVGELRVFVTRYGRASYTRTPDCAPIRGFSVPPRLV